MTSFEAKLIANDMFLSLSYMEAEKYEEAVRDYEKVCKMDRSRGETEVTLKIFGFIFLLKYIWEITVLCWNCFLFFRISTNAWRSEIGIEKKQKKRLLQNFGNTQGLLWGGNKERLQERGAETPSRLDKEEMFYEYVNSLM